MTTYFKIKASQSEKGNSFYGKELRIWGPSSGYPKKSIESYIGIFKEKEQNTGYEITEWVGPFTYDELTDIITALTYVRETLIDPDLRRQNS